MTYYVYAYLDPRKPGSYQYGEYHFDYEPFYIGKGCGDRMYVHFGDKDIVGSGGLKTNKIKSIFNSGFNPIVIKVRDNMSEDLSFNFEIELIKLIGRFQFNLGPLCNMTDGGEGASNSGINSLEHYILIHGLEEGTLRYNTWRKNLSIGLIGRAMPNSMKEATSRNNKGAGNPMWGKTHTPEARKIFSETRKNSVGKYKHSEETKTKMRLAHTGKIMSDEARKNMSLAMTGIKRNRGPMSEETKASISNTLKGRKLSEEHKKNISLGGLLRYKKDSI